MHHTVSREDEMRRQGRGRRSNLLVFLDRQQVAIGHHHTHRLPEEASLTCKSGPVRSSNEVGTSKVIDTDELKQATSPNKKANEIPTGTIRIRCEHSPAVVAITS